MEVLLLRMWLLRKGGATCIAVRLRRDVGATPRLLLLSDMKSVTAAALSHESRARCRINLQMKSFLNQDEFAERSVPIFLFSLSG